MYFLMAPDKLHNIFIFMMLNITTFCVYKNNLDKLVKYEFYFLYYAPLFKLKMLSFLKENKNLHKTKEICSKL